MVASGDLRLSAQRAFLGRVHPEMRLIKIKLIEGEIRLMVVLTDEADDRVREDISAAASEIIADFPAASRITEELAVSDARIELEDAISEGWIYRRAEWS